MASTFHEEDAAIFLITARATTRISAENMHIWTHPTDKWMLVLATDPIARIYPAYIRGLRPLALMG
jgi:hypothetical protein